MTDGENGKNSKAGEQKKAISIPKSLLWRFENSIIEVTGPKKFLEIIYSTIEKPEKDRQDEQQLNLQKPLVEELGEKICHAIIEQNGGADRGHIFPIVKRYLIFIGYQFELVRLQDEDTNEETLVISCFEKTAKDEKRKPHGKIRTNLFDLQSDIKEFLRYGVALQDVEFFAIASLIRKEYMQIKTEPITHELEEKQDELIETILDFLCQYITQNKIEPKNDLYYIPVMDFNNLLEQADIRKYQFNSIRKLLAEKEYIKRGQDALSVTFRSNDKRVYRALAFDAKKIDERLPHPQQTNESVGTEKKAEK